MRAFASDASSNFANIILFLPNVSQILAKCGPILNLLNGLSRCELGDEWKKFDDAAGNPAYYHPRLKILQTTNPVRPRLHFRSPKF